MKRLVVLVALTLGFGALSVVADAQDDGLPGTNYDIPGTG